MSFRTGFIARGFIPLGTLSVSLGYGPLTDQPIIFPGLVKKGEGARAPKTAVPKPPSPTILSARRKKRKKAKKKAA